MTEMQPYEQDFPELIQIPAASYQQTLLLSGVSRPEVVVHMMVLDIQVKRIVMAMRSGGHLAFTAPELIDERRVMDEIGWHNQIQEVEPQRGKELVACIAKATRILRGEMEDHEIWNHTPSDRLANV